MENSTVKKVGLLPSLILSAVLLTVTVGANKADASAVVQPAANAVQLAWWHGGWGPGWGGGWGWRPGWGGYRYHNDCSCWINRWGHRRCGC